jgi:hypothetical protein
MSKFCWKCNIEKPLNANKWCIQCVEKYKIYCKDCKMEMYKSSYDKHMTSVKHMTNIGTVFDRPSKEDKWAEDIAKIYIKYHNLKI